MVVHIVELLRGHGPSVLGELVPRHVKSIFAHLRRGRVAGFVFVVGGAGGNVVIGGLEEEGRGELVIALFY